MKHKHARIKKILRFAGEFLLFGLVLFVIWWHVGSYFVAGLGFMASFLLNLFGFSTSIVWQYPAIVHGEWSVVLANTHIAEFNLVPFFALLLAFPGFHWKRFAKHAAVGVIVLSVVYVLTILAAFFAQASGSGALRLCYTIMHALAMIAPFGLWLILYLRQMKQLFHVKL